jgi:repressor LexA
MMASLKIIRERKGVSQAAVAKELGISRQAYNNYELGKRQADYETLLRLAEYFGTTVENLIRDTPKLEDEDPSAVILPTEKIHMIPVFNSVAAGFGAYASSDIIEYIPLYIENDHDVEDTICITVRGQSMYPKIEDGDKIVVRRQESVDNGRVAVVMIGEEAVVKRVNFDGERLELTSFNPEYPPRIIEGEELANCRIVGLVQQVIKAV